MSSTKRCQETGCDRAHYARGLCTKHYRRLHNTGSTLLGIRRLEDARIAEVLEWIMDGDPLTTSAERAQHEPLDVAA